MISKDDMFRLRGQSTDSALFNQAYESNAEFKDGVDRVRERNTEMSNFEKAKFPSAMLDIYLGQVKSRKELDTTGEMMDEAVERHPGLLGNSAMKQLSDSPGGYISETISNIPGSALELGKSLVSAVAHPLKTGKSLLQLGIGGAANTIETIADLAGVKNAEDIFDLESEEVAKAVGDFYVDRYGSLEGAARTLRDDPVGFLSDVATVLTGVGGIVKGGAVAAGRLTGAMTKTATSLSPLGKSLSKASSIGGAMVKKGIAMEPVVIMGKGVFIAGKAAGSILSVSPKVSRLIHSSLRLHPNQIKNFTNIAGSGEEPAQFLLRKGILNGGDVTVDSAKGAVFTGGKIGGRTTGGILDDLWRLVTKSKDTVDNELAGVRHTYDLIDDAPDAFKALEEIQSTATQYRLEKELAFVNSMINKERLTLSEINKVKRLMDDLYNYYSKTNEPTASLTAERLRRVRTGIKEFIEDEGERFGLPDIRVLNQDTQMGHELINSIERAQMTGKGRNVFTLMDAITGGFGLGITGEPFTAAGIVIARRMLESPFFKTTLAKYLNRIDPAQLKKILPVFKGEAKHTKETVAITRKLVQQTAEDMKQTRMRDSTALPKPMEEAGNLVETATDTVKPGILADLQKKLDAGEISLSDVVDDQGNTLQSVLTQYEKTLISNAEKSKMAKKANVERTSGRVTKEGDIKTGGTRKDKTGDRATVKKNPNSK